MDKTIKQIIKENHANGIKDILWNPVEKKWTVFYLGKGFKPDVYNNFFEVMEAMKEKPGH